MASKSCCAREVFWISDAQLNNRNSSFQKREMEGRSRFAWLRCVILKSSDIIFDVFEEPFAESLDGRFFSLQTFGRRLPK